MGAMFELQKAIFAVVSSAVSPTPVYDDVPDNKVPPYVRIGETTDLEWDTDDSIGREATITIHSWSVYRGMKEVKDLMDAIKAVLHNQSLTVTGQTVVLVLQEFSETLVESDGLTRHGVQRFRILMEGS